MKHSSEYNLPLPSEDDYLDIGKIPLRLYEMSTSNLMVRIIAEIYDNNSTFR
jgi:hypothetical protein